MTSVLDGEAGKAAMGVDAEFAHDALRAMGLNGVARRCRSWLATSLLLASLSRFKGEDFPFAIGELRVNGVPFGRRY
jgi:hypothetical protein